MRQLLSVAIAMLMCQFAFAQDETKEAPQEDLPVRSPFETSILVDNHTVVSPYKGGLEFEIHHRFGTVTNGITDLFGIYAPSNIRLGFNFGITDKLMLGIGTTKDYKLQDFQAKYAIFQQTRSGKVPVSVSLYGNMVIDAREKAVFGPEDQFRELHRFSYFYQAIVARKFSDKISLQVAPGFAYFNNVETGLKNANFTLHAGGRAKVTSSIAVIAEYNQMLTSQDTMQSKPGLSAGIEIGTATHCFQIFMTNYSQIISQRNLMYNINEIGSGDFLLGFNITVRL